MKFSKEIEGYVMDSIYDAINKGWIEFMDGRTYTADEWRNMTDIEKENIGIRLTDKGREEAEDNNILKIYDELGKKKKKEGGLNLVKNASIDGDEIKLELTEEGEKIKKLGLAMGVPSERVFKTIMDVGLKKELSKYTIIDKEDIGNIRRGKYGNNKMHK